MTAVPHVLTYQREDGSTRIDVSWKRRRFG